MCDASSCVCARHDPFVACAHEQAAETPWKRRRRTPPPRAHPCHARGCVPRYRDTEGGVRGAYRFIIRRRHPGRGPPFRLAADNHITSNTETEKYMALYRDRSGMYRYGGWSGRRRRRAVRTRGFYARMEWREDNGWSRIEMTPAGPNFLHQSPPFQVLQC